MMSKRKGLLLEFSRRKTSLTAIEAINDAMAEIGSRVWPLDLINIPEDIRLLLIKPSLENDETERVKGYFLLPRSRLLEIIEHAGRKPNVPGGGELSTSVSNHGYSYPQVWIVQDDIDYSRFDRFHINAAKDGTGVDEVLQLLSGGGLVIHHHKPDGEVLTLHLDCPDDNQGWLLTYNGGAPHIGSLTRAQPGTKALVQVIGPREWEMKYLEDL